MERKGTEALTREDRLRIRETVVHSHVWDHEVVGVREVARARSCSSPNRWWGRVYTSRRRARARLGLSVPCVNVVMGLMFDSGGHRDEFRSSPSVGCLGVVDVFVPRGLLRVPRPSEKRLECVADLANH